jgi:hypothetical protein
MEADMEVDRTSSTQSDARRPRRTYTVEQIHAAGWGTEPTIRAWARQGLLPARKAPNARTWLFDADAVDAIWNQS